jgi:hypothetical protein
VDQAGKMVDFYWSRNRGVAAAKAFLGVHQKVGGGEPSLLILLVLCLCGAESPSKKIALYAPGGLVSNRMPSAGPPDFARTSRTDPRLFGVLLKPWFGFWSSTRKPSLSRGCFTVSAAATGHNAVSLGWIQSAANGDFQLGPNSMLRRGEWLRKRAETSGKSLSAR